MPTATRTFRVFVSSTFEDLKVERDALQRDVFPKLRKLCEENNARFQAIDLRWGVRDEAALDQQTLEICLREIERCQQTGIKPNFIVLLGERYGWLPLPARIEAEEFGKICDRVADADKRLVDDWYERDDNAVPPEFLLKPRTGEFADKDRWREVERNLHRTLWKAAQDAGLTPESLMKYEASATHQEILKGLGQSEEDRRHLFAFFREPATGATVDPKLEALKDDLRNKLPVGNVQLFRIGDIKKLCTDVEESLKKVILDAASKFTSRDDLDLEIDAHDRFAKDRCRIFVGRRDALNAMSDYLSGPERRPLVLHGESGIGKSAVMAVASQHYKAQVRLIRRFIGASPESASGHMLLTSLCKQIAPGETPVDYYKLEKAFQERLAGVTVEQPLVLFIDALDQLGGSDLARSANWLPPELPPHVKMIVSTTDNGGPLPSGLQVPLERMTTAEGAQVLDALLREARRTLQSGQRDTVMAHFERCGLPLYLKLAAEESRLWKSFSPPDTCKLGEGIAGVLDTLFDGLASNANHGPVLVKRSLGYLAAARYGLTEDEVLDVLTADDMVWNDFDKRKHHEVSERRLPVVVWSRLSLDLEPYLTERAAPGGMVIAFYHRQLAERAAERFLAGDEVQARHGDLSRHFVTRPAWLDEGRKTPNARRAAELVFQQREARQWREAEATLFDCPFLFAKVQAGMVLDLDDDYQTFLRNAPESKLLWSDTLKLLQSTLQLSEHVVSKDPAQFASQMRGRLLAHQAKPRVAAFLNDLDDHTPRPRLRPLWPALEPAGGPALRVLEGHRKQVLAVAMSGDGKRAVSGSADMTVRVWSLEGNQLPRILEGHTGPVAAVALSTDGKLVVSGSHDKTLRVWDLENNKPVRILMGHTGAIHGVALSGDGKHAVSASTDGTLRIWDLEGNQPPRELVSHTWEVTAVALSADGHRAISGSYDHTLRIWDPEGDQPPRVLEGHTNWVCGVALSADGKRAVSASFDKTVRIWDLEGDQLPRVLEGHTKWVCGVALSSDGKRAVSCSWDHTLRVWDLEGDQSARILEGHTSVVNAVALSADGKRAVSGAMDNTLRVWDLEGNRPRNVMQAHKETVKAFDLLRGHKEAIIVLSLSADGKRAVFYSDDDTVRERNLEGGQRGRFLSFHTKGKDIVALSADGKRAVSGSADGDLRVQDLEGNEPPRVFEDHTDNVSAVALSADGKHAVSGSWDETVRVWDLEGNQAPRVLEGQASKVRAVALSADGKFVIFGTEDGSVRTWDVEAHQPPSILEGHGAEVISIALSDDGKLAVSGSNDNTLRVWDLESSKPPRVLEGHRGKINAVAIACGGGRAVSGSDDQTLRVWDTESGYCLSTFTCDDAVESCACSGERIVAGDACGHLHLFVWEE